MGNINTGLGFVQAVAIDPEKPEFSRTEDLFLDLSVGNPVLNCICGELGAQSSASKHHKPTNVECAEAESAPHPSILITPCPD